MIPTTFTTNMKEFQSRVDRLKKLHKPQPYPMNTLLWNYRGVSKPNFYTTFKELVNHHKPIIVILTKTKIMSDRLLMRFRLIC